MIAHITGLISPAATGCDSGIRDDFPRRGWWAASAPASTLVISFFVWTSGGASTADPVVQLDGFIDSASPSSSAPVGAPAAIGSGSISFATDFLPRCGSDSFTERVLQRRLILWWHVVAVDLQIDARRVGGFHSRHSDGRLRRLPQVPTRGIDVLPQLPCCGLAA